MTTPPEILEQWRKEFEIGAQDCIHSHEGIFYSSPLSFDKDSVNEYFDDRVEHMWRGFLFARQTVRIPLPELISDDAGGYQMFAGDVKASIEAAGYRVLVNQQPAGQDE